MRRAKRACDPEARSAVGSLLGERRAHDVAAKPLEPLAIIRSYPWAHMQVETQDASAQGLRRRLVAGQQARGDPGAGPLPHPDPATYRGRLALSLERVAPVEARFVILFVQQTAVLQKTLDSLGQLCRQAQDLRR
jgi:hypothetical protein